MGGNYRYKPGPKLPVAVCDCCARFMWMRFQIGIFCHYCKNGWYIHSVNFIFHECPRCNGVALGCECSHGIIAVPREQIVTGEWVTFSAPDEHGCVEATNLDQKESSVQAISEGYPW